MNLQMGSHIFIDVEVPVLWGTRAILQDLQGRLSVIDLAGDSAVAEVVGGEPAPGIEFAPTSGGFKVIRLGQTLYVFSKADNSLSSIALGLPPLQIQEDQIRIGSNLFQGNIVAGSGVGLAVTEDGVSMGASLPKELAELVI